MFKKLRTLIQTLFSKELELQERLVRMVFTMAFLASIIGMGRILLGAGWIVLTALIPMCIISGMALWFTVKHHKVRFASWLLIISTNVILLPLVYIMSSGVESGTPIWFVLGVVYVFLLFKGKEFAIALSISLASYAVTYYISLRYPDILPPAAGRFYTLGDSYATLVCISSFVGLLLKSQLATYERERLLIESQKEEIERIARSKDAFFANMSHEIRTPINTIIGLNEMTLREDIPDEIAENSINIQNASKMLLTTISDILDLSKLESGKMELVLSPYAVSTIFSDLVNLIWIRAQQKELEFIVDIDPEIPSMLYGDDIRIKQVITNLLTNAVKYTDTGSVILSAKGERVEPDVILLRISVEDTGKGLRKESLENLFDSFMRFDVNENRNVEGSGLGLTIAKQLIEMMGGKIYVDSVYHKGSIFTVEIRQHIVNPQPIGIIDFAAQNKLANRTKYKQRFVAPDARILVVDDNDMNRMVAIKLLRGTKVKVDTAASGKECLKKTAENAYHVILMDHMMPEMDGVETLKAVREQKKGFCQKTPVIALTANVMSDANQVYQDMGFDSYLAKPVNAALLETSLLKYLPQELVEYSDEEDSSDSEKIGTINQLNSARKRKVAITADCICDLPKELLDRFQIGLMYTYVHTKEGRFCDLSEVSCDSLLEYLQIEGNSAHSSTAPPSEYEFFFADTLERAEHVLHITATASLSGAYPYASQASKSFDNVTVFDSEHISSGHGLMVLYAASLAEEGKSIPEICKALEQYKDLVCSSFLVPNTTALYRNGKLGGVVHKLCSGLNLHPVLRMSQNKLKLWKIEMGNMQRMDRKYVKSLLHNSRQIDTRLLFLTYAGCSVRQLDEILAEVEKYVKFDKIILQKASATVSSNCGIGIFGLMFVRKRGV